MQNIEKLFLLIGSHDVPIPTPSIKLLKENKVSLFYRFTKILNFNLKLLAYLIINLIAILFEYWVQI